MYGPLTALLVPVELMNFLCISTFSHSTGYSAKQSLCSKLEVYKSECVRMLSLSSEEQLMQLYNS